MEHWSFVWSKPTVGVLDRMQEHGKKAMAVKRAPVDTHAEKSLVNCKSNHVMSRNRSNLLPTLILPGSVPKSTPVQILRHMCRDMYESRYII